MAKVIVLDFEKSNTKINDVDDIFESSPSEAVIDRAADNRAYKMMYIKSHRVTQLDYANSNGDQRRKVILESDADTRIYLCGHGNGTDKIFARRPIEEIADELRKYGLMSAKRIVLYGCKTHLCAKKLRELLATEKEQLPAVICEVAGYNFSKATAVAKDKYPGKTLVSTSDGWRYFRTPGKKEPKKGDKKTDPAKIIYSANGEKYHFGI